MAPSRNSSPTSPREAERNRPVTGTQIPRGPSVPVTLYDARTPREKRNALPPIRRPEGGVVYMETVREPIPYANAARPSDRVMTVNDAVARFGSLPDWEFNKLVDSMDKWYGKGRWQADWIPKFYSRAVRLAEYDLRSTGSRTTVSDAFDTLLDQLSSRGLLRGQGGGSGSGGTSSERSISTLIDDQEVVDLTNPSTARMFLEDAMQNYLGRMPSGEEYETFLTSLNASQRAAPERTTGQRTVVSEGTATRTAGGTVSQSTQTTTGRQQREGGVQPQQLAQEFARSQEGAAETAVSTRGINAFLELLGSL